jgi:hypothetical protein
MSTSRATWPRASRWNEPDRSLPRLALFGLVVLIVLASLWTGTRIFGSVDAGMEVKRTPFGPFAIGIDGKLGEQAKKTSPFSPPAPQASGQVASPPPYYGPTPEETRVLAEMQAVTNRIWKKDRRLLLAAGQDPDAPQLELPQRALTPYELDQMRQTIKRLKELEQ